MGFLHKVAWLGLMLLAGFGQASAATATKDDSQAAIALLEKALAYYHDNGDKAFAAFSRQGEFVDKDRYVFVLDTKGVMLASGGPSSALIGRDVSEVLGPDLQKAFKDALKVPEGNGIQQAEYAGRTGPTARSSASMCSISASGSAFSRWVTTCHGPQLSRPRPCWTKPRRI